MAIRFTTTMAEVEKSLTEFAEKSDKLIIRALTYIGERCVIEAKDRSQDESWFDHTGNLRSSIGYVIVKNGSIVKISSFEIVKQGREGKNEGENLARRLANEISGEYVLIVVAGMSYAAKVEAMDNKCVIASAELLARREVPFMIEKIRKTLVS